MLLIALNSSCNQNNAEENYVANKKIIDSAARLAYTIQDMFAIDIVDDDNIELCIEENNGRFTILYDGYTQEYVYKNIESEKIELLRLLMSQSNIDHITNMSSLADDSSMELRFNKTNDFESKYYRIYLFGIDTATRAFYNKYLIKDGRGKFIDSNALLYVR